MLPQFNLLLSIALLATLAVSADIFIIQPTSATTWSPRRSTVTVAWNVIGNTSPGEKIDIYLMKANGNVNNADDLGVIRDNVPVVSRSVTFRIPPSVNYVADDDYFLKVQLENGIFKYSGLFTINSSHSNRNNDERTTRTDKSSPTKTTNQFSVVPTSTPTSNVRTSPALTPYNADVAVETNAWLMLFSFAAIFVGGLFI
ncbi:hypothetical protein BKA69DRAFT_1262 [Paraphysoderma sedebokerense]|nr:hypothetical protein BKA69DRAFT_1262 [Paraphysoderma sedebokerense]